MNEKRARELAYTYSTIEAGTPCGMRRDDEYRGRHSEEMKYGVVLQLVATVPDAAVAAAVIQQSPDPGGEKTAVVAAVDERALYLLECTALSPPSAPSSPVPTVRTRRLPLDPRAWRVSITTTFRSSFSGRPLHQNLWTFEIGGETLIFESEFADDSAGDDNERFARALATALGYELDAGQAHAA